MGYPLKAISIYTSFPRSCWAIVFNDSSSSADFLYC